MASLVPALPRLREVFAESRSWALDGRRVRRRLERRPEKRRPFERGSNVDFSRKCSCIFLISNRPSATASLVRTRPRRPRAGPGPTVQLDVADVWPHKAGFPADCGRWATQARVGAREATRGHVGATRGSPGIVDRRDAKKKGLAIPAGRVTMCDRVDSALVPN